MRIESGSATPITEPTTEGAAPLGAPSLDDVRSGLSLDRAEDSGSVTGSAVWRTAPAGTGHASMAAPAALRALAHAMAEDGVDGLSAFLASHPDEARALALSDRGASEPALRALIAEELGSGPLDQVEAYWTADQALDAFEETLEADVRETVRSTATMALDEQLRALEGTTPEAVTSALREAPPDSPLGRMRDAFDLRGDADDVHRVRRGMEHAREGLVELRGVLAGQTWSPEELPGTAARVMDAMGLSDMQDGSMAAAAFHRPELDAATLAHHAETAADLGHLGAEMLAISEEVAAESAVHLAATGHGLAASEAAAAFAGSAALPITLAVGGIAFGVAIHHAIEEGRADRTELARALGL